MTTAAVYYPLVIFSGAYTMLISTLNELLRSHARSDEETGGLQHHRSAQRHPARERRPGLEPRRSLGA